MITGIELPLELAALLCAGCIAAGVWAGRLRTIRRLNPQRPRQDDHLAGLHTPRVFAEAVDLAARRNAMRAGSQAVLHGRIDQLAAFSQVWNSQTREEVRSHVAAVMRTGLRRNDHVTLSGEGFTIVVPGADERAAMNIANRLRRKLARLALPQLGSGDRLTASFGVAAKRFGDGDGDAGLSQRARRALDEAVTRGADLVVPASEIEEILLLPAPAPSMSASVSTA